jgi:dinuclear metal center YbgI/SA1388 family protein
MASLIGIARFLNKELDVRKIQDSSKNGLQVKGRKEVRKIAFGVDACLELFQKASMLNCDLVIVHHGLLWKKQKRKAVLKKRLGFLKKKGISLYGAHLPLDLNRKHGNNIELCRMFDLGKIRKFGKYHGIAIGYSGELNKSMPVKAIVNKLNNDLKTKSVVLDFGKRKIKTIAFVSGGGASAVEEAVNKKMDVFITGELSHGEYHFAKDAEINLIAAGHYHTETLGVKALMPVLKQKFNIETVFIDIPTKI